MGKLIQGVLIDFDGVISKDSVKNTIAFIHEYVNRKLIECHKNEKYQIPFEFICEYTKSVLCFDVEQSVQLLFSSLGLNHLLEDFYLEFSKFERNTKNIPIENEFDLFLNHCAKQNIKCFLFSLASSERIRVIQNLSIDFIHFHKDIRNKSNILVYSEIKMQTGIDLNNLIYIDDSPLALQTGKISGLTTVMMINEVFQEKDYLVFQEFIDFKVTSFKELIEMLEDS